MFVGWCGVFVGSDRVDGWNILIVLATVDVAGGTYFERSPRSNIVL